MLTPLEKETLLLSLRVAGVAVAAGLPVALAVAALLARAPRFPGRALLSAAAHMPLVLPPVVVGYGLIALLGVNGPLGGLLRDWLGVTVIFTWKGAAVAAGVMAFPLMLRPIRQAMEGVDERLERMAATLGAGRTRVFLTVTLPLIAPGILAAATMGFARALGEFGATITFVSNIPGETRTLPLALYTMAQTPDGEAGAARLALLSAAVAVGALVASEWLARRLPAAGRD